MWTNGISRAQLETWLSPIDTSTAAMDATRWFDCDVETLPMLSRHAIPFVAAVLRDVFPNDDDAAAWLAAERGAALLRAGMLDELERLVVSCWRRSLETRRPAPGTVLRRSISAIAGAIALAILIPSPAQPQSQPTDAVAAMAKVLRYGGVSARDEDAERMAVLWQRAQQESLSTDDRVAAFRALFRGYAALHGRDTTRWPGVEGTARFAATIFDAGGRMDLTLPPTIARRDRYLHVATVGDGPTTLLLISDIGIDGLELYRSFIERHKSVYRMHVVTLPFSGAAHPLPWPELLDHAAKPWLAQIERELLALVDRPAMRGATVVGTSAGGYFAARLALARPRQLRSAVLVNASARMELRALENPALHATWPQRLAIVKSVPPAPQLWPIMPMPEGKALRRLIEANSPTHPVVQDWMAFAVRDTARSRAWTYAALSSGFFVPSNRYRWEFTATDLAEELGNLKIPVLALSSRHDAASPTKTFPGIAQWEEVKQRHPTVPLMTAVIDGARHYLSADAPLEFDRQLAAFLAMPR